MGIWDVTCEQHARTVMAGDSGGTMEGTLLLRV